MSVASPVSDDEAIAALQVATDRLFYRHGIAGVTVAAVRDESGLSMRRIYGLCPSKSDLVALWLRHRHATWTAAFTGKVHRGREAGVDPVDAVFSAVEEWLVESEFRGCGFVNTYAECNEVTAEHAEIIREHKQSLAGHLEDTTGRGDAMVLLIDGAIVHAAMFGDLAPVREARAAARILVGGNQP